jgi:hypothetical protein
MNAIEKKLFQDYSCTGFGIVGLLQIVVKEGGETVRKSLERSREIDQDAQRSVADDRSDNRAPGENIGSHSLMAKDSVRKEPVRAQAVNVATSVAEYVARTMVARRPSNDPAQPEDFVDWAELLRFFITHPQQAAGGAGQEWWRPVLDAAGPVAPEGHTVVLKPAAEVGQRAEEPHLAALELPYYDAALFGEERYRKTVDAAMVLDSGYTAGILGNVIGLVVGIVTASQEPGANAGRVVLSAGAGLLLGGALAGISGAFLAILGLLISRHAGVVTASYAGIVAGIFLAGYASSAVARGIEV